MSSSEIHVVAIVHPAPGKEARVKELLGQLADNVKAHEQDVRKYQVFEQYDGKDGNRFVVEELYKDQAAFDAHFQTSYFKSLGETIGAESLLAAELDIKTIKPFGGFASR